MKITAEDSRIKKSFLKEFSKLQEQQRLETIKRIGSLPSFSKGPGIREVIDEINYKDEGRANAQSKPNAEGPLLRPVNRITSCITPNYQSGSSSENHPVRVSSPDEMLLDVFTTFSSLDSITGEMSLAAVCGQNFDDFYGHGHSVAFRFGNGILGRYINACGYFVQKVTLFSTYNHDTIVDINVNAELPPNYADVVELVPGDLSSNVNGFVGARGYMQVFSNVAGQSESSSNNFLFDWKTANSPEVRPHYESNPLCPHSFVLPAGETEFYILVVFTIFAHSATTLDAHNASDAGGYGLVDLRAVADQDKTIIRNHLTNDDHVAPGPIKINSICLTMDRI